MFRLIILSFLTVFLTAQLASAQIAVDYSLTPTQLVQDVLLGGGVSVSNVTYTGGADMRGAFSGTSNIGIDEGTYFYILRKAAGIILPENEYHGTLTILKNHQ